MKISAITISQPWAWLISKGIKTVENRSWLSPAKGPILIHAGKGRQYVDDDGSWLDEDWIDKLNVPTWRDIPKGAVVAVAEMFACLPLRAVERTYGPGSPEREWAEGPYCFMLRNIRELPEPVSWRGGQGWWCVPPELVARVEAQLGPLAP